jgi:hypothetical protein
MEPVLEIIRSRRDRARPAAAVVEVEYGPSQCEFTFAPTASA